MSTIVVYDDIPQEAQAVVKAIKQHPIASESKVIIVESRWQLEDLADQNIRADIFITDIVTPEGEPSGIELVKLLDKTKVFKPNTQIIYVSGYLETALDVYETPHVYFLLKPINQEKMNEALNLAFQRSREASLEMVSLRFGRRNYLISAPTIRYVESRLRKIIVHGDRETIESYLKLDDFQDELPDYFVRCHRSFLVNLNYVTAFKDNSLTLADATVIPVSKQRAKQTQQALLRHLKQRGY